jgi:hypothetical protein
MKGIVTCWEIRVTKITGTRSDDEFTGTSVTVSLNYKLIQRYLCIYTINSPPLNTH